MINITFRQGASMKISHFNNTRIFETHNNSRMPVAGDSIQTKKMQMQGIVEYLGKNRAGYDEVFFRVADGRLMTTPLSNVIVVSKSSEMPEGFNGGINRCAPSQDVSYEKVLDDEKAIDREQTYEDRLAKFLEADDFTKILQRQHDDDQKEKRKAVVDIDFHGWKIRYRPQSKKTDKVAWMVLDKKGNIKHRGESLSDRDAVADAENWIKEGGGTQHRSTKNVNIDYNIKWTEEFAPEGQTFYVKFEGSGNAPRLLMSLEPQAGFRKTHIRQSNLQQSSPMSAEESNSIGLQPNGRYLLGTRIAVDSNTVEFPLIFQGIVHDPREREHLPGPGFTVAHPREK